MLSLTRSNPLYALLPSKSMCSLFARPKHVCLGCLFGFFGKKKIKFLDLMATGKILQLEFDNIFLY